MKTQQRNEKTEVARSDKTTTSPADRRRLVLHKETLRGLTTRELTQAAGGRWISTHPLCAGNPC